MTDSKYPPDWQDRRRRVIDRDEVCVACYYEPDERHVHHITPLSDGGGHGLANLVLLCKNCHRRVHMRRDYGVADAIRQQDGTTPNATGSRLPVPLRTWENGRAMIRNTEDTGFRIVDTEPEYEPIRTKPFFVRWWYWLFGR